jgi:hypothetical protein
MSNRVAREVVPPASTPPSMRVRTRRFRSDREVSLLCPSCSAPRSAVAGFLQTPPHGDALALDLEFSSCILRLMKVNLLQGICTPTLTPMPGVHRRLQWTLLRAATELEPWAGGGCR